MKKSELIKLLSQLSDDVKILLFHEKFSDDFVVMIHDSLYKDEVLLVPKMYTYLFDDWYTVISEIV